MKAFLSVILSVGFFATIATGSRQEGKDKILGCYFGAWATYRPGYGQFEIEDIDASLCTHGYYGFAKVDNKTWELSAYDPWYDMAPDDCDPGLCSGDAYRRFTSLSQHNKNFLPLLSVGGWNAGSKDFSHMAADPAKKKIFLDSIIPFIRKFGFKGLDLDWEYPGSREGADEVNDKENFSLLVEEMGALLKKHNFLFTAAVSPGKETLDIAYDVPRIIKVFDFLNIMSYDYHGWWGEHLNYTGVNAPLHIRPEEENEKHPYHFFNTIFTIEYYMKLGAPKDKICLGLPIYGRGFTLKDTNVTGLYCPAVYGIPAGPYTSQAGIWGYFEILQAFNNRTLINLDEASPLSWKVVTDDCYKVPYAYNGPYWISYDTEGIFDH